MAKEPWIASQDDRALLQELLNQHRLERDNAPSRPPTEHTWSEGEDHQAPEIYVAKPQTSDGIPQLLRADPSGTATATATAETSGSEFDEPGKAECDIYQIVDNDSTGDPELHLVGLGIFVHNVTTAALAQDWIPVARTKFGKWVALSSTGGSGPATIRFQVLAAGPFLGDTTVDCDYVVATILGKSCNSTVTVGDEVNVWDPSQCHFNLPLAILIGSRGTATDMFNDLVGEIDCSDDRLADGACRFVVHSLCCTEEICG